MKKFILLLAAAMPALSVACGSSDKDSDEESVPKIDCATATVPKYADLTFLQSTCAQCHSSTKTDSAARQAAPNDVNFDTYDAAKGVATRGVAELYENPPAMPPEGSNLPAVTDAQRVAFNTWAQCGTPQ